MKPILVFLLVAAIGNAVYHVGQKALPQAANPMVLLMAVYAFAFVLTGMAAPFFAGKGEVATSSWILGWPVLLLALGVVLIEIGFLLAYRSGGSLQWSGVAVNAAAAALLVPVAILVFRETFSISRALGIAATLAGLWLLSRD
jgi:drug/metabolite transporter (DMT)-like permease